MISRQLSRVGLHAAKSITHAVEGSLTRLRARFSKCDKLGHQAKEFEKVLLYNPDKVIRSFQGSKQLLQLTALLSSTYYTPQPRKYKHTHQLFLEVLPLLKPLLEKEATSSMELAGVVSDCLQGIALRLDEETTPSDNTDLEELKTKIVDQELGFLDLGIQYVARAYPLLNIEEKDLFKSALAVLDRHSETFSDTLRSVISHAKERIAQLDEMPSSTYTAALLAALGLKPYLKTESSCYDISAPNSLSRSSPSPRLTLHSRDTNTNISLFALSDSDIKSQTRKLGEFFAQTPNLQSLIIDDAPIVNPSHFAQKDAHSRKLFEYSQYLTKEWPFLYRFVGRAELRGFYSRVVFDREFFAERDNLMYYKMNGMNEVFDAWSSVKALFMGVGERPKVPKVYLGGVVGEERVLAAMAGLGGVRGVGANGGGDAGHQGISEGLSLEQAEQLNEMVGAYNIVCGLRSFREAMLAGGCVQCGGPEANMHDYYNRCEKAGAGIGRGIHEGKIGAGVVFEAFQELDHGHSGVVGWSEGMFDHGLPQLLEMLRQKRFGVEHEFKRAHYIKGVYAQIGEKQTINTEFMEKLAVVENVLGVVDTTINQFVDLMTTEQLLTAYELKKERLVNSQILLEWSPGYVDTTRDQFCAVENCVLPSAIDDSKYDHKLSKIWEIEDQTQKQDFISTVEQKLDTLHKIDPTQKPQPPSQRGRKIKSKPGFRAEEQAEYEQELSARGLTPSPERGSDKPVSIVRQKKQIAKAASAVFVDMDNLAMFEEGRGVMPAKHRK